LIHAIGNYVFLKNPNVDITCTSAKIFYYELINSIRNDKYQVFKEKYRNLDFLILSDIQFLAFKEKEQEEFFLTFNPLYKSGKQIIITSSCHPEGLIYFETRLISRFKEGLMVNIQEPDLETRVAILQKKAEEIQLKLSYEIIYYIAYIIPANTGISKIEEVITKLNTYINLNNQKEVDFALVRQIVEDIKPIEEKKISIEMIQKYTAEYFGLKPDVLLSRKSAGNIVTARNIAMYLARRMTRCSLTDIGKSFGSRDSNIVLHSYDKIKEQADKERKLRIIIGALIIKLKCSLIQ
ncbi:MAG: DnaA/Hda family protein, partial [Atribacterota bacterium]